MYTMTKRERFLTAARRGIPDRVPVFANLTPQVAEVLGKTLGFDYAPEDSFLSTRISHVEMLNYLGNDAVGVGACRQSSRPTVTLADGSMQDEWGIVYRTVGLYGEATGRPLCNAQSVEDIDAYDMPDPSDEGRFELASKNIARYKDEYAIIGDHEATLFELAWNLVGLEKFLMDFYDESEYIIRLLDRITEYNTRIGLKLIELGVDMIWMGDDFGTQNGMMISPAMYREHFKPRQKAMIQAFKKANSNIIIAYHSCGSILPIIDDLIEAGIDVLNPVQPLAAGMDLAVLKRLYGDRLAFFGGIDVQQVLPHGTENDVRREVELRFRQGGEGGGLILAPAHNIQPDTPPRNIFAMFEAITNCIYK